MKALLEKEAAYADKFANPYHAAARGFIDEVIDPSFTRIKLIKAFASLENKVDNLPKKNMAIFHCNLIGLRVHNLFL